MKDADNFESLVHHHRGRSVSLFDRNKNCMFLLCDHLHHLFCDSSKSF